MMILPHSRFAAPLPQPGQAVAVTVLDAVAVRAAPAGDAGTDARPRAAPRGLPLGLQPRARGIRATSVLAPPITSSGAAPLTLGT